MTNAIKRTTPRTNTLANPNTAQLLNEYHLNTDPTALQIYNGVQLCLLRTALNISSESFAAALEISEAHLEELEFAVKPISKRLLTKICALLKISVPIFMANRPIFSSSQICKWLMEAHQKMTEDLAMQRAINRKKRPAKVQQ